MPITIKMVLMIFYILCLSFLYMNIWGGWSEVFYEKNKNNKFTWYWLGIFKIAETKENCIKFLKRISWTGLILVTLSIIVMLFR